MHGVNVLKMGLCVWYSEDFAWTWFFWPPLPELWGSGTRRGRGIPMGTLPGDMDTAWAAGMGR